MAGKIDVTELRTLGYSYVNAANFMVRVAREQAMAQEAVDKHNAKLLKAKAERQKVAEMDDKIEHLKKLLEAKRNAQSV